MITTLSILSWLAVQALAAPLGNGSYCQSNQPCWPSTATWNALNSTLNGKLIQVQPMAKPCFNETFNAAQCSAVQSGYTDGLFRANHVGAAEILNWEACGDDTCWLNTSGKLEAGATCSLGRIAPYAVALQSATAAHDAAAAIAFAKSHNIKLTIKNTGHSYLGQSTGKDSLSIWTHELNDIDIQTQTTPPTMRLGAGVVAQDAYMAASNAGHAITLGAYGSVGIAGGYVLGGGHGPLSPLHGLAVDNIAQFSIVTADGVLRTVNEKSYPDLFFALRGGGGGSWGIVLDVWYKLLPATPMLSQNVTIALIGNKTQSANSTIDMIDMLGSYQLAMSDMGWASYHFLFTDKVILNFHLPSSDIAAAKTVLQPIFNFFAQHPDKYAVVQQVLSSWLNLGDFVNGILVPGAILTPVASGQRLSGRFVPRRLLADPVSRRQIATAIMKGKQINDASSPLGDLGQPLSLFATSPGTKFTGLDTGANPAWRGNSWEILYSQGWTAEVPSALRQPIAQAVHLAAEPLRSLTPGGGCYVNEADQLEADWQTAFFGANYPKLLAIKNKYDPQNFFNVYKGVGWTGETDPAYACYLSA